MIGAVARCTGVLVTLMVAVHGRISHISTVASHLLKRRVEMMMYERGLILTS